MQLLPGFRDFFPEDCARRNYIVATWREVARRYGFVEYDGPLLESVELYKKKSGGELLGQLFEFTDKGERHVSIRPEMTPTLARMVIAREREYKKPLRWFSASQFFRYEKQQKGRLREFCQLNCDIVGEASIAADAEMLALTIDLLRAFGLTDADFVVRVSDREAWLAFLRAKDIDDVPASVPHGLRGSRRDHRSQSSTHIRAKVGIKGELLPQTKHLALSSIQSFGCGDEAQLNLCAPELLQLSPDEQIAMLLA